MSIGLLLLAAGCVAISGLPGLLTGRRSALGAWAAAMLNVAGSLAGGIGLVAHFLGAEASPQMSWAWSLPIGRLSVGLDALSAVFLAPMLLISALGSIYGLEYWPQSEHPSNGRKLRLCWGLLTGAMMLVVLARDGVVLLMGWEIMALAAFFLVCTEDRKPEVRQAGWIYLVAAHVGTLFLFALFGLLHAANGSFELWPAAPAQIASWQANAIFITGLIGFGLKSGMMPLHVWLPGAHANAPSHVSAILSGVLLKTGVYGIIRVAGLLPYPPAWWGGILLAVGGLTAVLGIAFAVAQHDYKRLLAYSSIENIGIIMIGIGLAVLGRAAGRPEWVVLGLGGALFHVINHSLFKPLLFFGAGAILHATGTRQMDLLGGLGKSMPKTFIVVSIGAVAICGLPPLNGFASEILIYIGLLKTAARSDGGNWVWAALAAPALAAVGALAVAAFVKLLSAIFTGTARSAHAEHAHEPGWLMRAPMLLLAACCALLGLAAWAPAGVLDRAIAVWDPAAGHTVNVASLVPFKWISALAMVVILAVAGGAIALRRFRRARPSSSAGTWDCGYVRPTARIQYTSSSFGQMLTALFSWALWPRRSVVALGGLFARKTRFSSAIPDTVLDRGILPAASFAERAFAWARPIQRGPVQVYLLYVLATLLLLMLLAWW